MDSSSLVRGGHGSDERVVQNISPPRILDFQHIQKPSRVRSNLLRVNSEYIPTATTIATLTSHPTVAILTPTALILVPNDPPSTLLEHR